MTIAIFGAKYKKNIKPTPMEISDEKRSELFIAEIIQKITTKQYIPRTETPPIKPNSSARVVNMKSVCFSGRKFSCDWVPCIKPLPFSPPDPRAILDCAI